MTFWIIFAGFLLGAAILGFLLAWLLKPSTKVEQALDMPDSSGGAISGSGNAGGGDAKSGKDGDVEKIQEKYDALYESKLDVDTALVAAESTLEGLKLDYEKLERDLANNNNRFKELQVNFEDYKSSKEDEIQKLKDDSKSALEGFENVKFQLAKSNRVNEKLQESLHALKEENQNLSNELHETKEEMEVVKTEMNNLNADYSTLDNKANKYEEELNAWQDKYNDLNSTLGIKQEALNKADKEKELIKKEAEQKVSSLSSSIETLKNKLKKAKLDAEDFAKAYTVSESRRNELSSEIEARKKEADKELKSILSKLETVQKDYDTLQEREVVLDDRFNRLKDKHTNLEDAYEEALGEKESLQNAFDSYKEDTMMRFAELENNANEWVLKYESADQELVHFKEEAEELQANKEQLLSELEKIRKKYEQELSLSSGEFDALNENFEDLKKRYFDINIELNKTKLEKERIDLVMDSFKGQLEEELEMTREENKKLSKAIARLKMEKRSMESNQSEVEERLKELELDGADKGMTKKLNKIIQQLQDSISAQRTELEALRAENEKLKASSDSSGLIEENLNYLGERESNLKDIDGIEPEMELILNEFGIYNFNQLANVTDEHLDLLRQVVSSEEHSISDLVEKARKLVEA